jgi:hypothetical protein
LAFLTRFRLGCVVFRLQITNVVHLSRSPPSSSSKYVLHEVSLYTLFSELNDVLRTAHTSPVYEVVPGPVHRDLCIFPPECENLHQIPEFAVG